MPAPRKMLPPVDGRACVEGPAGEAASKVVPQFPQKRAPGELTRPQFGQRMFVYPSLVPDPSSSVGKWKSYTSPGTNRLPGSIEDLTDNHVGLQ
jgi:hypothetical protein